MTNGRIQKCHQQHRAARDRGEPDDGHDPQHEPLTRAPGQVGPVEGSLESLELRRAGEDIDPGELVLRTGMRLTPNSATRRPSLTSGTTTVRRYVVAPTGNEARYRVRFRTDGILSEVARPPPALAPPTVIPAGSIPFRRASSAMRC